MTFQYYRIMALEFHVDEEVGLGHFTLCEFIDIGARRWILTERLRNLPKDLGRPSLLNFSFLWHFHDCGIFIFCFVGKN